MRERARCRRESSSVVSFVHARADRSRVFSHAFAGCAHRRARWARRDGVDRATTRRRRGQDDGLRETARTWTSARIDDGGGGDAARRRRRRPRAGRSTRGAFESDALSIARAIQSISIDRSIDRSVTGFFEWASRTVHERSMCPSRRRIAIFAWAIEVWVWAQRRGLERGGRGIVRRRRRRRRRRR